MEMSLTRIKHAANRLSLLKGRLGCLQTRLNAVEYSATIWQGRSPRTMQLPRSTAVTFGPLCLVIRAGKGGMGRAEAE